MRKAQWCLLWWLVLGGMAQALTTPCEDGDGNTTPSYDETVAWCRNLAASSPLLHYTTFGVSPQGRDLPLVIADLQGQFSPQKLEKDPDHIVLLVQACIHAGESCGKDAGMALLRDLATERSLAAALLNHVTLLFVPIFNVDGHERFGAYNRINQNGPEQMGWRVTAQNLNLNRDYLKADTPEMQAWLGLWQHWSPDFFIDIHSTDGADYQYALTYGLETHGNMDPGLTALTKAYANQINAAMTADRWPMVPYVSFRKWHDPRSGLMAWAAGPRFSQGYTALQNRPGLLIETHMLKDYATRVRGAELLVRKTMSWLNDHAPEVTTAIKAAEARTASESFREQPFALTFKATDDHHTIDFLGVAYETLPSAVTGGSWNHFTGQPQTMQLEYYDTLVPDQTVSLPVAYIVPPEWQVVSDRLKWHGVETTTLTEPVTLAVRSYRFEDAHWRDKPYEGHHPVDFKVVAVTEKRTFPTGSVLVPMHQATARVAAHLLEPQGPDSLVRWGFFDAIFARVEYAESYVIEQMIPEILQKNPTLAEELGKAKSADPEFAGNPGAIRDWFYQHTPYFDSQYMKYPVGMIDDEGVLAGLKAE